MVTAALPGTSRAAVSNRPAWILVSLMAVGLGLSLGCSAGAEEDLGEAGVDSALVSRGCSGATQAAADKACTTRAGGSGLVCENRQCVAGCRMTGALANKICPAGSACRAGPAGKAVCRNTTTVPARPPTSSAATRPPVTTTSNQCPDGCYSDEICRNRQCVYVGGGVSSGGTGTGTGTGTVSTGTITEGGSCVSNSGSGSCAPGLQCPVGGGVCFRSGSSGASGLGRTGDPCSSNFDCVSGFYCPTGGGMCGEADQFGNIMGSSSGSSSGGCSFDSDCGSGLYCNPSEGVCYSTPNGGSSGSLPSNTDECGGQCTSSEYCSNGYCEPRTLDI